ncbi:hypothetical protein [Marinilabilia salmonicolor]|uniref:hypothetical protein n=1 Tax=Marinilabilia salmonicolor TaxID=989 RepID=UPI00029AB3D1|nr:hypothetical protein [Marinilabilia salmonicolor]
MKYFKYLPVDPDFYEILETIVREKKEQNVFYFLPDNTLGQAKGEYHGIDKSSDGEFMILSDGDYVRLDRIITINGKPGPAFDEYDNYANECLSCKAGYEE